MRLVFYNKLNVTGPLFVAVHCNPLWQMDKIFLKLHINKEIIPEVKLVPEAQPRDTNNQGVLTPLATVGLNTF